MNKDEKISINKEIRNQIKSIIKLLSKAKLKSKEEIKTEIKNILNKSNVDITLIVDDSKNTLAQILVKEEKEEHLEAIVNSYLDILKGQEDKFYNWFLNRNTEDESVIEQSVQSGNTFIIKYVYNIMERSETNKFRIEEGENNIFHYSAIYNQTFPIIFYYEKIQKYFKDCFIIDIPNQNGITPFLYSCIKGNKNAMDLLLDLGSNIDSKDNDGNSCLHYAVSSRNLKIIKKLLIKGANKYYKNNKGLLPIDIAIQNGDEDIINLLKDKNIFFQIFSTSIQIKAIKGNRNNLTLLLCLLTLFMIKITIFSRINLFNDYSGQLELVPYIPDLISAKVENKYSSMQYKIKDFYEEENCPIFCGFNFLLLIISMAFELFIIILVGFFLCFTKGIYSKKNSKKNVPSLIKLFEENNSVCVKCRRAMKENCVHCAICGLCVDDFDHHCFWLNTCINQQNKCIFLFFIYSLMIEIILNISISIIHFIGSFNFSEVFYKVYFNYGEYDEKGVLINQENKNILLIIWRSLLIIFIISNLYVLIFLFIPVIPQSLKGIKRRGNELSQIEDSLLDNTNRNTLFLHI